MLDNNECCRKKQGRVLGIAIFKLNSLRRLHWLTFKQNEGKGGSTYVDMKERGFPGRINSKYKGPGAVSCWVY